MPYLTAKVATSIIPGIKSFSYLVSAVKAGTEACLAFRTRARPLCVDAVFLNIWLCCWHEDNRQTAGRRCR